MEAVHPHRRRVGVTRPVTSAGVKTALVLTVEFWGFHQLKGSREIVMTLLITMFVEKQVGHQVAMLGENVPVVSNVHSRFSQRIRNTGRYTITSQVL